MVSDVKCDFCLLPRKWIVKPINDVTVVMLGLCDFHKSKYEMKPI